MKSEKKNARDMLSPGVLYVYKASGPSSPVRILIVFPIS